MKQTIKELRSELAQELDQEKQESLVSRLLAEIETVKDYDDAGPLIFFNYNFELLDGRKITSVWAKGYQAKSNGYLPTENLHNMDAKVRLRGKAK